MARHKTEKRMNETVAGICIDHCALCVLEPTNWTTKDAFFANITNSVSECIHTAGIKSGSYWEKKSWNCKILATHQTSIRNGKCGNRIRERKTPSGAIYGIDSVTTRHHFSNRFVLFIYHLKWPDGMKHDAGTNKTAILTLRMTEMNTSKCVRHRNKHIPQTYVFRFQTRSNRFRIIRGFIVLNFDGHIIPLCHYVTCA